MKRTFCMLVSSSNIYYLYNTLVLEIHLAIVKSRTKDTFIINHNGCFRLAVKELDFTAQPQGGPRPEPLFSLGEPNRIMPFLPLTVV